MVYSIVACGLLLAPAAQFGGAGHAAPSSQLTPRVLFAHPHDLLPQRGSALGAALGDIDGDGDLDVALSLGLPLAGGSDLELWRNTGAGKMRLAQHLRPVNAGAADFADLDGDLDLDLLVGDVLLVNDGQGEFTLDPFDQPDRLGIAARKFADLDGDGDLDVYATYSQSDALCLNDGTGHFTDASASLPPGASGASTTATGDVDGDGDIDVLASGQPYPTLGVARLYLNDGSAHFSDASAQLPPPGTGYGFALVDVDGDLDLDALSFTGLYLNDGSGGFTNASAQLPPSPGFSGQVVDVDGDGDPDLVSNILLWLDDGAGVFSDAPGAVPSGYGQTMRAGDVDGDGDVDLLRVQEGDPYDGYPTGGTELLLNSGAGNFLSIDPLSRELPGRHGFVSLLADMNGDGYPDAITGAPIDSNVGSFEQKTFLGYNDGQGRFTNSTGSMPPISTLPTALAAADVDGDGDTELLIGGRYNYDGTGGGLDLMFQSGGAFLHGPGSSYFGDESDIAVGDLDGDGDPDVLHGNDWDHFLEDGVWLDDGTGTYVADPGLSAFVVAYDVELLDLEHDGDLDALISGTTSALYRHDGTSWTDVSAQLGFSSGYRLASGDVDGDGDTDLLVGDPTRARLFANDGSGAFSLRRELASGTSPFTFAVRLDDTDADGDLDAFTQAVPQYGSAPGAPVFFENNGHGHLQSGAWLLPNLNIDHSAFGDVDQDGDRDMLADGMWFNLERQLSWRTPIQLGRTLTLALHGPQGEPWTLYSSLVTGHAVIPGQGTLLLGPPLATRGTGTFDRHGNAAFGTAVPNNLALIGTTLYWQALAGRPPHFTNRETTTITGY